MKMCRRNLIGLALCLVVISFISFPISLSLVRSSAQAIAAVTVESKTAPAGATATIDVSVSNVPEPGLADVQGSLKFNPAILQVKSVSGLSDYTVWANIDNTAGKVTFVAIKVSRPYLKSGAILRFEVQAKGNPGTSSALDLGGERSREELDVFRDADGKDVPHRITDGTLSIEKAANNPPKADFTFMPSRPTIQDTVKFTDLSEDPDPGDSIKSWLWEFGDGATSNVQSPSHKYAKAGTYTVKLTVTDSHGASNTISKQITVTEKPIPPTPQVLVHNFPNPAKDRTTFIYSLPAGTTKAILRVFDITGKLVYRNSGLAGKTELVWDLKDNAGNPLPNGTYFYFVEAWDKDNKLIGRSEVKKLVIQRS